MKNEKNAGQENKPERGVGGGKEILRCNSKGAHLLYFHSDWRVAFGALEGGSINTNKLAEIPCEVRLRFFF